MVYATIWSYFQPIDDSLMKPISERIIKKFKPSLQNPFPLIANFDEVYEELKIERRSLADRVPEYKMLPDPDDGGMTREEINAFMNDLFSRMKWMKPNANTQKRTDLPQQ